MRGTSAPPRRPTGTSTAGAPTGGTAPRRTGSGFGNPAPVRPGFSANSTFSANPFSGTRPPNLGANRGPVFAGPQDPPVFGPPSIPTSAKRARADQLTADAVARHAEAVAAQGVLERSTATVAQYEELVRSLNGGQLPPETTFPGTRPPPAPVRPPRGPNGEMAPPSASVPAPFTQLSLEQAHALLRGARAELAELTTAANNTRTTANQAASAALGARQEANAEARELGRTPPFPGAEGVRDTFDAGNLTAEQQVAALGVPSLSTPQEAGAADAARVAAALESGGPVAAMTELNALLNGASDAGGPGAGDYHRALIDGAQGTLAEIGDEVMRVNRGTAREVTEQTTALLAASVGRLSDANARALVAGFTGENGGQTFFNGDFTGALRELGVDGTRVTHLLASEIGGDAGARIADIGAQVMEDVRGTFEDAANRVDELNNAFAALMDGFGPAANPAEREAAAANFREAHAEDYERFEAAAVEYARFGREIDELLSYEGGAMVEEARRFMTELPRMTNTEAGRAMVLRAVEDGAGQATFLDHVTDHAATLGDDQRQPYIDAMAFASASVVGEEAMRLREEGRTEAVDRLIDGLARNPSLFGVETGQMAEVASFFKQAVGTGRFVAGQLDQATGAPGVDASTTGGQLLNGLGLALSLPGLANGLANFSSQDALGQLNTLAGAVGTGANGGALVMNILGRPGAAATFSRIAGVAGNVGTILGGLSTIQNFRNGNITEGIFGALNGGAALLMMGSGALPVIGTVVSVGVFAAQLVVDSFRERQRERALEVDARQFLRDVGFRPEVADQLGNLEGGNNVGDEIIDIAERLGVPPTRLFNHLNTLSGPEEIDALRGFVFGLQQLPNPVDELTEAAFFSLMVRAEDAGVVPPGLFDRRDA